jgi:ABC-type multidrug transport system fused ATPase/permease subunit
MIQSFLSKPMPRIQTTRQGTHPAVPKLPTRHDAQPHTRLGTWLFRGGRLEHTEHFEETHPWYEVVWLTGVDYFSSLAYQPGIALLAVGALAPPATLILILVTLAGALPVYSQVASRSFAGQGSIAILENLLSGWRAKILVLVLIGFAATDFVITMTLSAADAARHAIENPFLRPHLGDHHELLTMALLTLLAIVFVIGFREAIRLAVFVAIPYILLNLIVLGAGLGRILHQPLLFLNWRGFLRAHYDWTGLFVASALVFPKLALGLSGFETGVSVMPLVENNAGREVDSLASPRAIPVGRVRNTRKLLVFAATLMGCLLVLSSLVTTLLIPPAAYALGGAATGRATAYLAHELLGNAFGTLYDLSTIAILWFAGASAMAGLINLIPRYLPRFGMAPHWVSYRRPMVLVLFAANLVVTIIFRANVEAQGGAYATGVLVLILSAAIAVTISLWRESLEQTEGGTRICLRAVYFLIVSLVFAYTVTANVFERPAGVYISAGFIFAVLLLSAVSRYHRSKELRVSDVTFADQTSATLWPSLAGQKVNLVPLEFNSSSARMARGSEIRKHYHVSGPMAFLHVHLLDNRSEFITPLRISIRQEQENFVIDVRGAVAIANSIAYISELLQPKTIFLELTRQNLMMQSLRYLFWGEGEVGLLVYSILLHYWEWADPAEQLRPILYLMSA